MIRRLILIFTLVYIPSILAVQLLIFAFGIIFSVILIGEIYPLETTFMNNLEIFNESNTWIILYCMMCFTDFILDLKIRNSIGIFVCCFILLNLIINLYFTAAEMVKAALKYIKIYNHKRKMMHQMTKENYTKLKNSKEIRKIRE